MPSIPTQFTIKKTIDPVIEQKPNISINSNATQQVTEKKEERKSNTKFAPNILNEYDTVTYHWVWYTLPEHIASLPAKPYSLVKKHRKVIAESGSGSTDGNGFFIDNVKILNVPTPNSKTLTAKSLTVSFSVREPNGIYLYDFLQSVSGGRSFTKIPYYLELTFIGRGTNSDPQIVKNMVYAWEISIQTVDVNLDSNGADYLINAVSLRDLAGSDKFGTLMDTKTIEAKDFKEFIQKLKMALYKSQEAERTQLLRQMPNRYEIEIDDKLDRENLAFLPPESDEYIQLKSALGQLETQYPTGDNIIRVLSSALAATQYCKKIATELSKRRPTATAFEAFEIELDTLCTGYDYIRNEPSKTFTYYIHKSEWFNMYGSANELTDNKKLSDELYNVLITKKTLRKGYSYLYTGMNTEVIQFDCKFNTAWYTQMPSANPNMLSGKQGGENSVKAVPIENTAAYIVKKENEQVTVAISKVADASTTAAAKNDINSNSKTIAEANAAIQTILSTTADLSHKLVNEKDPEKIKAINGQITTNENLKSRVKTAMSVAASRIVELRDSGQTQPSNNNGHGGTRGKGTKENTQLDNIPVNVEQYIRSNIGGVGPSNYTPVYSKADNDLSGNGEIMASDGSAFFSTYYNQKLSSATNGDMIKIDLKIKGDPYWLGMPTGGVYNLKEHYSKFDNVDEYDASFSYLRGEVYIQLMLYLPSEPNINGVVIKDQSRFLSGVYLVNKVENVFENGTFTQTLTAVRMLKIESIPV